MAEFSYNGWLASPNPVDFGGLAKLVVAGESFAPGVRAGDVHTAFQWLAEQLHARVEPVVKADWHQADDWGYSYRQNRNANNLSCHSSGTAIDYNATRHPNGKRGTFNAAQVAEIRRILAEADGIFQWGGDYTGTADEMHFEVIKGAPAVAALVRKIQRPEGDELNDTEKAQLAAIEKMTQIVARQMGIDYTLGGPNHGKVAFPGWAQLGGKTVVDALAEVRDDLEDIKARLDSDPAP